MLQTTYHFFVLSPTQTVSHAGRAQMARPRDELSTSRRKTSPVVTSARGRRPGGLPTYNFDSSSVHGQAPDSRLQWAPTRRLLDNTVPGFQHRWANGRSPLCIQALFSPFWHSSGRLTV